MAPLSHLWTVCLTFSSLSAPAHSAATCCEHRAATMGCHLVMNPQGARHWFKVPLPSQCRGTVGMMTCWLPAQMVLFHSVDVAAGQWRWKCAQWQIFSFASFWSVNLFRNLCYLSYFWNREWSCHVPHHWSGKWEQALIINTIKTLKKTGYVMNMHRMLWF